MSFPGKLGQLLYLAPSAFKAGLALLDYAQGDSKKALAMIRETELRLRRERDERMRRTPAPEDE